MFANWPVRTTSSATELLVCSVPADEHTAKKFENEGQCHAVAVAPTAHIRKAHNASDRSVNADQSYHHAGTGGQSLLGMMRLCIFLPHVSPVLWE